MTAPLADAPGYASFDTALGTCALAWTARGLAAMQLPEATPRATIERVRRQLGARMRAAGDASSAEAGPTAPPPWAAVAIERITRHLAGDSQQLGDLPLDLEGLPAFRRRIYLCARKICSGRTMTYGELAAAAGVPGGARAVGQAMAQNPLPIVIPCHRVLAAGQALGGFSARGGRDTKLRLLAIEGARPQVLLPLPATGRAP